MRHLDFDTLAELRFTSRLEGDAPEAALAALARHVWTASRPHAAVTGVLRRRGATLEQAIEGPRATVLAIAARLLADPAHAEIRIAAFGAIPARRFAEWRIEDAEAGAPPRPGGRAPIRLAAIGDAPPSVAGEDGPAQAVAT